MPQLTFNPGLTLTGFRTTRPRCLGPPLWAKLSIGLRTTPSLNSFTRNIRKIALSGLEKNSKAGFTLRLRQEEFQYAPLCVLSAPLTTLIRHENEIYFSFLCDHRVILLTEFSLKGHCPAIWQLYKKPEGVFASIEFQN